MAGIIAGDSSGKATCQSLALKPISLSRKFTPNSSILNAPKPWPTARTASTTTSPLSATTSLNLRRRSSNRTTGIKKYQGCLVRSPQSKCSSSPVISVINSKSSKKTTSKTSNFRNLTNSENNSKARSFKLTMEDKLSKYPHGWPKTSLSPSSARSKKSPVKTTPVI